MATAQAALIPQAAALVRPLSVFHNVYMGRLDRHSTWRNLRMLAWPARAEVASVRAAFIDEQGNPRTDTIAKVAGGVAGLVVLLVVIRRVTR